MYLYNHMQYHIQQNEQFTDVQHPVQVLVSVSKIVLVLVCRCVCECAQLSSNQDPQKAYMLHLTAKK